VKKTELLAEQARLHALANELARKHWGVDYTGTIKLTRRFWRNQQAAYVFNDSTGLREIRMSTTVNATLTPDSVEGNLLHELVHWRLQTQGIPCGDTSPAFIAEIIRVGAPVSQDRYAQAAYRQYLREAGVSEVA